MPVLLNRFAPIPTEASMTAMPPRGILPLPLVRHLATARHELDRHLNDHGLCSICGSVWPCERAVLADLALASL
jgi:hypothetical protein